jgi:hypothetical protein
MSNFKYIITGPLNKAFLRNNVLLIFSVHTMLCYIVNKLRIYKYLVYIYFSIYQQALSDINDGALIIMIIVAY